MAARSQRRMRGAFQAVALLIALLVWSGAKPAAGQTHASISALSAVVAEGDSVTFRLQLQNASGAAVSAPGGGTFRISSTTPQIVSSDLERGAHSGPFSITTSGRGTFGSTSGNSLITFYNGTIRPGQSTFDFSITPTRDNVGEGDETFGLTIWNVSANGGNLAIRNRTASVRILNRLQVGNLTGPATVYEGQTAEYTVTFTGGTVPAGTAVQRPAVTYRINRASGNSGSNFCAHLDLSLGGGSYNNCGVTRMESFQGGTRAVIRIPIRVDAAAERDGTQQFTLSLTGFSNIAPFPVLGSETLPQITTSIIEPVSVTLERLDGADRTEGSRSNFRITLSQPGVNLKLCMEEEGTALQGFDFTLRSSGGATSQLNAAFCGDAKQRYFEIALGNTQSSFDIGYALIQDNLAEDAEMLHLRMVKFERGTLGAGVGIVANSGQARASVTINANYASTPGISLDPPSRASVQEGGASDLTFRFSRNSPADTVRTQVFFRTANTGDVTSGDFTLAPAPGSSGTSVEFEHSTGFGSIIFSGGNGAMRLSATQETVKEAEESIAFRIYVVGGALTRNADTSTTRTITIPENDDIVVAVASSGQALEGQSAGFHIVIGGGGGLPTSVMFVNYEITGGEGITADDYTAPAMLRRRVSIEDVIASHRFPHPIPITLPINIVNDGLAERAETLRVRLTRIDGGGSGASKPTLGRANLASSTTASVTIPADGVFISLNPLAEDDRLVSEGDSVTFTVEIESNGVIRTQPVEVQYAIGGAMGDTADASDYSGAAATGTITIQPRASSINIELQITDDTIFERREQLSFRLTGFTQLAGGAKPHRAWADSDEAARRASITIQTSDGLIIFPGVQGAAGTIVTSRAVAEPPGPSPVPAPRFQIYSEGDGNTDTLLVRYQIGGTAIWRSDYARFGSASNCVLGPDGECSPPLIFINADSLNEGEETITLTVTGFLDAPQGTHVEFDDDPATVVIPANDPSTISIAATLDSMNAPRTYDEGEDALFPITLSGGTLSADATLTYTISGDVTAGDLVNFPLTGSVTLPAAGPNQVSISLRADSTIEGDETLTITLTGVSGGGGGGISILEASNSAGTTIPAHGGLFVYFRVGGETTASVAENETLEVSFCTVGERVDKFQITYTAGGTATRNVDYDDSHLPYAFSSSQTFTGLSYDQFLRCGSASAINASITSDRLNEGDETVVLTLTDIRHTGGPPGLQSNYERTPITITITDDDPISLSIERIAPTGDNPELAEGGVLSLRVTASGAVLTQDLLFDYQVLHQSGTDASDYSLPASHTTSVDDPDNPGNPLPGARTVTISRPAGFSTSESVNFNINITNDALIEGEELLSVRIFNARTAGTVQIDDALVEQRITETESAVVSVARKDSDGFEEGGSPAGRTAVFTVSVTGTRSGAANISFQADGCGNQVDCTFEPANPLVIPAGQTQADIILTAVDDMLAEETETITLKLLAATTTGAISIDADNSSATAVLTDNDALTATIARTDTDGFRENAASGSGTAVFTVTIAGGQLPGDATVSYTVTGCEGEDTEIGGADCTDDASRSNQAILRDAIVNSSLTITPATGTTATGTITLTALRDYWRNGIYPLREAEETITVTLTGVQVAGGVSAALGTAKTATAGLQDQSPNGPFSRVKHRNSSNTGDIAENGGTAEFTVELFETLNIGTPTNLIGAAVPVYAVTHIDIPVTVSGTGIDKGDFNFTSPTGVDADAVTARIRIRRGRALAHFTLTATDDSLLEATENLTISLGAAEIVPRNNCVAGTGCESGSIRTGTVTVSRGIADDDGGGTTVKIELASDDDGFTEGAEGTAASTDFTVTLSGTQVGSPVDIYFQVDLHCVGRPLNDDFHNRQAECNWTPRDDDDTAVGTLFSPNTLGGATVFLTGDAHKLTIQPSGESTSTGTITLTAIDDALIEAARDLYVVISHASLGVTVDLDNRFAKATLVDDDVPKATLSISPASIAEGGAAATIKVALSGPQHTAALTVPWSIGITADTDDNDAEREDYELRNSGGELITGSSGSFTFAYHDRVSEAGELVHSITIRALDDGVEEVAEKFAVSLGTPTGGGGGTPETADTPAIGTIQASEGDESTLTLSGPSSLGESTADDDGNIVGATATYTIKLTGDMPRGEDLTVNWTVTGNGERPAEPADFAGASDSLPSGELVFSDIGEMTFTLTLVADALVEGAESFKVSYTATGGGPGDNTTGDPQVTSITDTSEVYAIIVNRDRTDAENEGGFAEGGENEDGYVKFRIRVIAAELIEDAKVSFTVTGCGTQDRPHIDCSYPASPITVPVSSGGSGRRSFRNDLIITAVDDAVSELAEEIRVTITSATSRGRSIPVGDSRTDRPRDRNNRSYETAILTDNDALQITIGPETQDVAETDTEASFTISVAGGAVEHAVLVNYALSGTATGGAATDASRDYTGASGSFSIAIGGSTYVLKLPLNDDGVNEPDETIVVTLTGASANDADGNTVQGTALGAAKVATATISANDDITASIASPGTAAEGSTASFSVTLGGATRSGAVKVSFSAVGSGSNAAGSGDFSPASGSIEIASSATGGAIEIAITDDALQEQAEEFTVSITGITAAAMGGSIGTVADLTAVKAAATIPANDAALTVSLTAPTPATAAEDVTPANQGDADVAFGVKITGGQINAAVTISYTLGGSASRGVDYSHGSAAATDSTSKIYTANFSASGALGFDLTDDSANEPSETIVVTLTAVSIAGNAQPISLATGNSNLQHTFTITDTDAITAALSGGGAVAERGEAVFTVTLSGGTHTSPITVAWALGATPSTTDDDAEADDYSTTATSPLQIAIGESSGEIRVAITDDGVAEPAESFALTLGALGGGGGGALTSSGSPAIATIAASRNTTREPTISGASSVTEGAAAAEYSIAIDGDPPTGDIRVTWSVAGSGSAPAAAADMSGGTFPSGGTLTFTPENYDTAQTISIAAAADTLLEGGEQFTVTLMATGTTTGTLVSGATLDVTITDEDSATVSIAREDDGASDKFMEGGMGADG
ncbi:MAG: hypothetical protein OXU53_07825, partial [Deltaproteobacteria bacterium]|nr:hypothetical protein [Deltaproteobacteria bacterium]